MKTLEKNPFRPCVTDEQLGAFDASLPETYTGEALVDAILKAYCEHGVLQAKEVAHYLDLDVAKLSTALEVLTGHNYTGFRDAWQLQRLKRLQAQHPDWTPETLARHLGFRDRSGLWRLLHRDVRKKEYAGLRTSARRLERASIAEWLRNHEK